MVKSIRHIIESKITISSYMAKTLATDLWVTNRTQMEIGDALIGNIDNDIIAVKADDITRSVRVDNLSQDVSPQELAKHLNSKGTGRTISVKIYKNGNVRYGRPSSIANVSYGQIIQIPRLAYISFFPLRPGKPINPQVRRH
jgi:hypothetical protein